MKPYLLLIALMMTVAVNAQEYVAPDANPDQMKEAKALTAKFDDVLSLTEKQILLIEKINGYFIARRDLIVANQDLNIEEKNRALEQIYYEQGREMSDVLTRVQVNKLKEVRGDLQPMLVIIE